MTIPFITPESEIIEPAAEPVVPEAASPDKPAPYQVKAVTVTMVANGYIVSHFDADGARKELVATAAPIRGYDSSALGSVLEKIFSPIPS